MVMALFAGLVFVGAIFIVVWFNAIEMGLSLSEWLSICDKADVECGEYLRQRYLG